MVALRSKDFLTIIEATSRLGFQDRSEDFPNYQEISATVLRNDEGFHFDLFLKVVANKFTIHPGIIERSELLWGFGFFKVRLLSDSDLFLSKSVTGHDMDLDDMHILFLKSIDSKCIIQEVDLQGKLTNKVWEAMLLQSLEDLENHAKISVGWKDSIEKIAVRKLDKLNHLGTALNS